MLRGFLVENQACCYCTMRASMRDQEDGNGGAPRTRTLDTIAGATVFKTASSTGRTRSVCEMAPPLGIAPSSHRLTGGPHTLCVERNLALPAGIAPASFRLEGGCLWSARPRELNEMVARLGAAPSVSSSQARRIAVFLARDTLCRFEMAACAGIAPATFRSTGGCSS